MAVSQSDTKWVKKGEVVNGKKVTKGYVAYIKTGKKVQGKIKLTAAGDSAKSKRLKGKKIGDVVKAQPNKNKKKKQIKPIVTPNDPPSDPVVYRSGLTAEQKARALKRKSLGASEIKKKKMKGNNAAALRRNASVRGAEGPPSYMSYTGSKKSPFNWGKSTGNTDYRWKG